MAIWDDYVAPAAHAALGVAEVAAHSGPLAKVIPGVGIAAGALGAAYEGYEAYHSEGDERWDHLGSATMNAVGAIPLVGSAVGATELGLNGLMAAGCGGIDEAQKQRMTVGSLVGEDLRAIAGEQPSQQPGYVPPKEYQPPVQPVEPGQSIDPDERVGTTEVESF